MARRRLSIIRNLDGSYTISAPVHGNDGDIFKMKYYGYTKAQAVRKFNQELRQQEDKTFINKTK